MIKANKLINYEIELIINKNLYDKKVITEDIYQKANEQLTKLIEVSKPKANNNNG